MKEIFQALARFAAHLTATSVGFVLLLLAVLIPFYGIRFLLPPEIAQVVDWTRLEHWAIYVDIALYVMTAIVWTIEFIVELVRAVIKLFK
jgi:hypothetical protein